MSFASASTDITSLDLACPVVVLQSPVWAAERLKMGLELYLSLLSFDQPAALLVRQPALTLFAGHCAWLGLSKQGRLLELLEPESLLLECPADQCPELLVELSPSLLASRDIAPWLRQQSGWISLW